MERRKSQTAESPTGPVPLAEAEDQVVSDAKQAAATDLDPAKLQQPGTSTPNPEPRDDAEAPATTHASRTHRTRLPDPFGVVTISLTAENDGPKARLLRNSRAGTYELQFDEKPGKAITDQIKDEGWHWESRARHTDPSGTEHKGAWVKEFD